MPFLRRSVAAVLLLASVLITAAPAPAVSPRARTTTPSFNGSVHAIAHRGPVVYVGGEFTVVSAGPRNYPRSRLAAYDSRTGVLLPWAPAADGTVRALAATADSVYAAGDFRTVGGRARDSLVRLHPISGEVAGFQHALSGTAYTLATGNGRLYLGGSFTHVDDRKRANLAAFTLDTGKLDRDWKPAADDTVHTLAVDGRDVLAGGGFHLIDGVKGTLRLARLRGSTGRVDERFLPRVPAEVRAITHDAAGVYVATAGVGGRAIAYRPDGTVRWQRVFDGDAAAIAVASGTVYVGGHFDSACLTSKNGAHGVCTDGSEPRYKLAAVTPDGRLTPWAPQANGVIGVRVLSVNRTARVLEAGGDFTVVGGVARRRFAAF